MYNNEDNSLGGENRKEQQNEINSEQFSENGSEYNEPEVQNAAEEELNKDELKENEATKDEAADKTGVNPDGTYHHVYADPWREPVYKPTSDDTGHVYSPNYYNARTYEHAGGNIRNYETQKERKERLRREREAKRGTGKGKKAMSVIAIVLVCAIISTFASVLTANSVAKKYSGESETGNQVVLGQNTSDTGSAASDKVAVTGEELTGTDIYTLACKQVVGLTTSVTTQNVFGQETSGAVTGSGFVISEDGYIMTNYHVVQYAVEGGFEMAAMFNDGTEYSAKVVGYDADNDIAVVKIDATGLGAVTFGSSSDMAVGETVYTVGNPLGELAYTMTSGIVSALDREISTGDSKINMFQIDAAVNSGNSGGPVYNENGEIIGVVTAKYSSTGVEGLGFAIPIDDAVGIATQIIETGYVSKAQLGVSVVDVSEQVSDSAAEYWQLPDGAWVYSVNTGSAAEKAGIKAGDIITAVNGTVVADSYELKAALKAYAVGDTITLTIFRYGDNSESDIQVTLEEAVADSAENSTTNGNNMQVPSVG